MTSRREAPRKIRLYLPSICSGWLRKKKRIRPILGTTTLSSRQEQRTARRARLEGLKQLLTASVLGTA